MDKTEKIRWGICGCANIAIKNCRAIKLSFKNTITCVASRNLERCRKWCEMNLEPLEDNQTYEAIEGYSNLIRDDVDAIYLPTPTTTHLPLIRMFSIAKKHVLCEKPVAVNTQELKDILNSCQKNKVQFMDGVMFMHHPRLKQLKRVIDKGNWIGEIQTMHVDFSFLGSEDFFKNNIRIKRNEDPLGCLGDLGWYCVRIALLCFSTTKTDSMHPNFVLPFSVRCFNVTMNSNNVPISLEAEVFFNQEKTKKLSFFNSFLNPSKQCVRISGSKKNTEIIMENFVSPKNPPDVATFQAFDHNTKTSKLYTISNEIQEKNMFDSFSSIVLNKEKIIFEPDYYWYNITLATQCVVDALYQSSQSNQGDEIVLTTPLFYSK